MSIASRGAALLPSNPRTPTPTHSPLAQSTSTPLIGCLPATPPPLHLPLPLKQLENFLTWIKFLLNPDKANLLYHKAVNLAHASNNNRFHMVLQSPVPTLLYCTAAGRRIRH